MPYRTPSVTQQETFVNDLAQAIRSVAEECCAWLSAAPRSLLELEQEVRRRLQRLGGLFVQGLCRLQAQGYPEPSVPCPCGAAAHYQRRRTIQVQTLLGPLALSRPYYLCPTCHQGQAPLDAQLGVCASSLSAGLEQVLALLGVCLPFEEAAQVVEQVLTLSVSPTTVQQATERVGAAIAASEAAALEATWHEPARAEASHLAPSPERLYLSLDGTMVHLRAEGWKEVKLAVLYTTRRVRQAGREAVLRGERHSFVATLADCEAFGPLVWLEAARRGVLWAKQVVVVADGAQWIWRLVADHFPQAVQIVDWYHASQYLWRVAAACYGEGSPPARAWAEARLAELWAGQVEVVLESIGGLAGQAPEAQEALTYLTNNQERMRYATYRAQGLQIGSGSMESGCKYVIGARLKQAGMRWSRQGAQAVAKARAWWKSGRWEEALALLPPLQRSYHRQAA